MADKNAGEPLETSPFRGDLEGEPVVRPRRSFSALTLALSAGVMLVAGVIVGIQAQKAVGGGSGAAADQRAAMRQGAGPGGYGGFGGQGGQGGPGGYGGFGGQNGQNGQNGRPGGQGGQGNTGNTGGTGPGAMTVGTVQKVEGGKVYVRTVNGSVVTVTTTGETAVRISREGEVSDLEAGKTVVVQGARGEDGSVTATSISEGAARGR
ncbi:hypothetical protein [Planobispora takensis]|uniref:DUF5666 domain-containing protein n=1 Tax=Planobispora takensis TaxID=1367882 RepID=A0A8J3SYL5_9ACTN|nr:hypothetical protein [Planobispora takensis]GII02867.1 hypothetical protein Pta02_48750 [Planobispora takensis]